MLGDPQLPAHADIAETLTQSFGAGWVRHRPHCEWPRALSAKFTVSVAIAHAFFAQFFPVNACLAQFPTLPSICVFITWWRRAVISGRRRGRRTICDGASYKSACGDAAENASTDGAADAVCICRGWSHHCSNGNAGSANRRDERFVHVFSPAGPLGSRSGPLAYTQRVTESFGW